MVLLRSILLMGVPVSGCRTCSRRTLPGCRPDTIRASKRLHYAQKVRFHVAMNAERRKTSSLERARPSSDEREAQHARTDRSLSGAVRCARQPVCRTQSCAVVKNMIYRAFSPTARIDLALMEKALDARQEGQAVVLNAGAEAGFKCAETTFTKHVPSSSAMNETAGKSDRGQRRRAIGCMMASVTVVAWYPSRRRRCASR